MRRMTPSQLVHRQRQLTEGVEVDLKARLALDEGLAELCHVEVGVGLPELSLDVLLEHVHVVLKQLGAMRIRVRDVVVVSSRPG